MARLWQEDIYRPAGNAPNGQVGYFPACATRMFGAPTRENGLLPATDAMIELLRRAGFDPVVPEKLEGQCCGQPFLSKGFPEEAERVANDDLEGSESDHERTEV